MQKVISQKLNNGLEVNFIVDSRFTTSCIYWGFKIGSFNDNEETQGLAHLFEHMVGKRTQTFPQKSSFVYNLEKKGIEYGAYTYSEFTLYVHRQKEEDILTSLALMAEALFRSIFTKEDLENEKKVVLSEGNNARKENATIFWKEARKNFLINNTDICGTKESLLNIDLDVFANYYNSYKDVRNMRIVIAIPSKKHLKNIKKYLEHLTFGETGITHKFKELQIPKDKFIRSSEVNNLNSNFVNVNLVYKTGKLNEKERLVFEVLSFLLSNGFSGLFIKKLRDELGLVYWVQIYDTPLQTINLITIDFSCEEKSIKKVITNIVKIINEITQNISDLMIGNVLKLIVFHKYKNINPDQAAINVFYRLNSGLNPLSIEEEEREILKVTPKEVKVLVKKIFRKDNFTKVIIK